MEEAQIGRTDPSNPVGLCRIDAEHAAGRRLLSWLFPGTS
jgi:hypothetical protein